MAKNKQKVLILRGLQASGKTTYARELEAKGWVRVEKDEIRKNKKLFKDGVYNHKRGDEGIVLKERNRLIRQALDRGKNVVSSDTNLKPEHVTGISAIAREYEAQVETKDFLDIPLAELIKRDNERSEAVGEQVIRETFHRNNVTLPTFLKYDPSLPWAVCSDVDGTITNGPKDRSPYEWHKVGNDELNLGVAKILDGIRVLNMSGVDPVKVFLFSGRSDICRPETEAWLEKNDIEYDMLVMRPHERESEKDYIIKSDLIKEHIIGKYNILFWLDDRPQVCDMLRDVYGINVLQRGDPNYKF